MGRTTYKANSYHADTILYKVGSTYYDHDRITGELSSSQDAQPLIEAALNRGGKVYWTGGEYNISATINPTVSDLTIDCEPNKTILRLAGNITGLKFGSGTYRGGATATRYEKVKVRGLTINCGEALGTDIYGIWFHTVDNFEVSGCHIYNQGDGTGRAGALLADYCIGGVIDNNHIEDTINGIVPRIGSKGIRITNNHVHDTYRYDGITPFQTDGHHVIANNYVHDCGDNGILLDGGPTGRNPHCIVSGNVTHGNVHEGIESYSSDYSIITGNESFENGRHGIAVTSAGYNSFVCDANHSYNNTEAGFYIFECRAGTLNGNVSRANNTYGIYLNLNASYLSITGNNISLNQYNGIYCYRSGYNNISHNSLNSNCQAADNTYDEIFLTDNGVGFSLSNTVSTNTIRSVQGNKMRYGVKENAAGDNKNLIINNRVIDYRTGIVHVLGANSTSSGNAGNTPDGALAAYDTLETTYDLELGGVSDDGLWWNVNNASATNTADTLMGVKENAEPVNVFYITTPAAATAGASWTGLALSAQSWRGFQLTVDMRTVAQTRTSGSPATNEVASLWWHDPGVNQSNFFANSQYRFVIKSDGSIVLSKKDFSVSGSTEVVIASKTALEIAPVTWALNTFNNVDITHDGTSIIIEIDGTEVINTTDTASFTTGRLALVAKDCQAEFKNILLRDVG